MEKRSKSAESDALWKQQVQGSIGRIEDLKKHLPLSPEEERGIHAAEKEFSWRVTPYYAGLMDPQDPDCPIKKQAIPDPREMDDPAGLMDPLEEEKDNPAPNVIKFYPDRVAWTVSGTCPVLCRHCLRKRMVGKEKFSFTKEEREAVYLYLAKTPEIRDVLITGGDPLMYPDELIEEILARLREIDHVEIVRIGTRTPCTMPQRITEKFCTMLKKYHPVWLNTQFNHPRELTEESAEACRLLADSGVPLGNQSVLLRGVNDDAVIMKKLVQGLVKNRVRPYYLYQAQLLAGTAHFRTPIETGLNIIRSLRGFTTGFAVPTFVLDTPYGKIPMSPNSIVGRDRDTVHLKSWTGRIWKEPNPRENTTAPETDGFFNT